MKLLPTLVAFCLSLLALPFLALLSSPGIQQSTELTPSSTLPDSTPLPSIDDWAITIYPHHGNGKTYAVHGKLSLTTGDGLWALRDDYDNLIATFPACARYASADLDDEWLVYDTALRDYGNCSVLTPTPAPVVSSTGQTQTLRTDPCELGGCGIAVINIKTGEHRTIIDSFRAINVVPSISRNHVIWGE